MSDTSDQIASARRHSETGSQVQPRQDGKEEKEPLGGPTFVGANIPDTFGSKLLKEVLSYFSEMTPHTHRHRCRRPQSYSAGTEPKLNAWSAPECIQKRLGGQQSGKGLRRKYWVQSADRGKYCRGRPQPSPSPTMFSDTSAPSPSPTPFSESRTDSRSSSPVRRMPKVALQFPILRQSGWTSSIMKNPERPASQQCQYKDMSDNFDIVPQRLERPRTAPFRHAAKPHLFGQHPGDLSRHSPATSAADSPSPPLEFQAVSSVASTTSPSPELNSRAKTASSPSSARMSIAPRALMRDSLQSTGQSDASYHRGSKLAVKNAYASAHVLDESDDEENPNDKKEGIWKISLASSKYDRMRRVNGCRKVKQAEAGVRDRDKVAAGDDLDLARESFARYFKFNRFFGRTSLLLALKDFGIRARSREEKTVLSQIFDDYDIASDFTFRDFCNIIEEARVKLRTCRSRNIFLMWHQIEPGGGSLPNSQVMQLLNSLNVAPRNASEASSVQARIEELSKDDEGLYPMNEVEFLVQHCREYIESDRRKREREIREKYLIAPSTYNEFQDQFLEMHDMFTRLDENNRGALDVPEVVYLLAEFGICLRSTPQVTESKAQKERVDQQRGSVQVAKQSVEAELEAFVETMTGGRADARIPFPHFLSFASTLRKKNTESKFEEVSQTFRKYDKFKKGVLDLKEVCSILVDLNFQPRTPLEQEAIAELFETIDVDGSGTINLNELVLMMVRLDERRMHLQRFVENTKAEAMGVSRKLKYELRTAFENLDTSGCGSLTTLEALKAVQMMQWKVPDSRVLEVIDEVDKDCSGSVDFLEFMELTTLIDSSIKTDLAEAENKQRGGSQEPEEPPKSAEGMPDAEAEQPRKTGKSGFNFGGQRSEKLGNFGGQRSEKLGNFGGQRSEKLGFNFGNQRSEVRKARPVRPGGLGRQSTWGERLGRKITSRNNTLQFS